MNLLTVILNYRTAEMTLDSARAAVAAHAKLDAQWRIEIVDNDSCDGSYERLCEGVEQAGWDRVEVVASGHNGGFGAGNNYAMRRALASGDPPDFIYLLNSDAFPTEDAITALVNYMQGHPAVGIAGSYIHGVEGEPHLTAFRFPSIESELLGSARLGLLHRLMPEREVPIQPMPSRSGRVDWLAGASMMLRREALDAIGLFDETFFLYFEETDLCRRAALAGWPTHYVVESRVSHVGHGSTGLNQGRKPMPRYWFDSRRHYFRKNHGRAYSWVVNALSVAGLASFKARASVQQKQDDDPVNYLRDFIRYNFLDNRP